MSKRDVRDPVRVLFVCTQNSARSQIAEALLSRKSGDRFHVASAGSNPAETVHPLAVRALRRAGIEWDGRRPQALNDVAATWDLVITLCDRAREKCPRFPGRPVTAHWGLPDPTEVIGDEPTREAAFWDVLSMISRRIDLLCALPHEKLHDLALRDELQRIAAAEDATIPREG